MNESGFRLFVLAVVAMAHVISFLQVREASIGLGLPARWQAQSLILLAFSFGLTAFIVFARKPATKWVLMLIALLVIILVGLPSGELLGQQLALFVALILVSWSFVSVGGSLAASAIAVALFTVLKRPLSAWGVSVPAPTLYGAIAASLAVMGWALLCNILIHLKKRLLSIEMFRKNVEDASQRLMQANLRLQEYASVSEEAATTAERKRLARDLHDTTAYTLSNLVMMMEAGIDLASDDNSKLRHLLVRARDFAIDGLVEARRVVDALRPSQVASVGGLKAVFRLVKTFEEATHIETLLHAGDAPWNFGETENITVYRLVQEGLSNALRHGSARRITISFNLEKEGLRINIQDDGVGFSELSEGHGIKGMRERIEQLGGSLQVTGSLKAGTLVSAWLPIADAHAK